MTDASSGCARSLALLTQGGGRSRGADGIVRLRVGRLIDGTGEPALKDCLLSLHQGKIQSIEPCGVAGPWPEGTLDFSTATILPILMDAHVHLALSGTRDPQRRRLQAALPPQEIMDLIAAHLRQYPRWAVGAVRDGGDREGHVLAYLLSGRPKDEGITQLAATDHAWHAPGRYGAMIGRALTPGHGPFYKCFKAPAGMRHFKIVNSGMNSLDFFGRETPPQFAPENLAHLFRQAHRRGLSVMVHANGTAAVQSAVQAGCDSIEHGYFMGTQNLAVMADRQIAWVPTMVPMAALTEDPRLSAAQRETAQRTLEAQLLQVAAAQRLGVPVVLGTDAGSWGVEHGAAVWQELYWLSAAGLSVESAVQCAASRAARLLHLENQGALQIGRAADLAIIEDQSANFSKGHPKIKAICFKGRWRVDDLRKSN